MQGNKPLIANPDFDRLIPKARWTDESIKRNAKLEDTLAFLSEGVSKSKWQVAKIIPLLKGDSLEETCYAIWYRLYTGIRYQKDEDGKEQIRSPRRTWWGHRGDCDDFSVFVSCILSNMNIAHLFRIAMYNEKDGYQHIYPVAIAPDGTEIIIDCVLPHFNKEVPYIKKIDKKMELQFLDGIDDEYQNMKGIDADDLLKGNLGELGKRFRDTKFFKGIKKGLHVINRVNLGTILLRSGILICMKLNLLNVAGNLRYTYLNDAQAKQKGFIMKRFAKLKNVRDRLEKIFYGAGGKEENLKKAILKGNGNRNKEVPLGGLGSVDMEEYNTSHSVAQILGADIYNSELAGIYDLGTLGFDPGTDTAVATAMTALTALAAIIKSIGSLKPKGGGGSSDPASPDANVTAATDSSSDTSTPVNTNTSTKVNTPTDGGANTADTPASATGNTSGDDSQNAGNNDRQAANTANNAASNVSSDGSDNASGSTLPATTNPPPASKDGFMKKASDWVKANKAAASVIGLALAAGLGYGGYKLATRGKKKTNGESNAAQTVSGVPKRKRKKGTTKKQKHGKIKIQKLR
jgi:hypothetical protein